MAVQPIILSPPGWDSCIAKSTKKAWDVYQKEGRLRVGRGIVFLPLPPAGFWDRVTLGILECPRTGCVDHAGLKFIFITISTSRELGWQTWSTMTSLYHAGNHTQNVPHAEQVHYQNWATPQAHKFVLLSKALVILLYVNLSPSAFSLVALAVEFMTEYMLRMSSPVLHHHTNITMGTMTELFKHTTIINGRALPQGDYLLLHNWLLYVT